MYLSITYKKHQPGKLTSSVHILVNLKYVLNNTDHQGDIYGSTGNTGKAYISVIYSTRTYFSVKNVLWRFPFLYILEIQNCQFFLIFQIATAKM